MICLGLKITYNMQIWTLLKKQGLKLITESLDDCTQFPWA